MKRWSAKDVDRLRSQGKVADDKIGQRKKKKGHEHSKPNLPAQAKRSREKDWIEWNLLYWCNQNALELLHEHRFDDSRKYRFDYAIPALKIAVEYEGGIFMRHSGHNTPAHYTKDTEKYNLAQRLGWRVLRFTALNYKNMLAELNKNFAA